METKTIIILIAVVIVSGCTQPKNLRLNNDQKTQPTGQLKVERLNLTDNRLNPGHKTRMTLNLRNYHSQTVKVNQITLYNTGFMKITRKKKCQPPIGSIPASKSGVSPLMQCTWVLKAPSKPKLSGFESKAVTMKVQINYTAGITNEQNPLKVEFKPLAKIRNSQTVSQTYSNGEVKMKVSTESPVPLEGTNLDIKLSSQGVGRVPSGYKMKYRPSEIFGEKCKGKKKPVIESQISFSCRIKPGFEKSVTRNLIISTSYKYIKSPSLDVEVVNN